VISSGFTRTGALDYCKGKIAKLLVDYFGNDFRRITHALEVMKYAERIMENRENYDYDIVISCSLLHDVGIKLSEAILGYNNGKTQEEKSTAPQSPKNCSRASTSPVTKP
jgi:HD superfamily phosphohydrolase YqeK